MSDYWISDGEGRVLGPVGLPVLEDLLAAGRITQVTRVSTDGQNWRPLEAVPALHRLWTAHRAQDRQAKQQADAKRLRAHLEACRTLPPHELFGVPKGANLAAMREAFFRLSKKFHPDTIPNDAEPALKDACALAFRFYAGAMAKVEQAAARAAPPPPPPPPPAPPRYDPTEFVGIHPLAPGAAKAEIRVTDTNVGMFTDHPLMNLRRGAFFLADQRVLPLGTTVALTFNFDDPPRTITARGKVAWEDTGRPGSPAGFGITFHDLAELDRDFLRAWVERARPGAR